MLKRIVLLCAVLLAYVGCEAAKAQTDKIQISATSAPYRIEWKDGKGEFIRAAFNGQPEMRQPLAYVHRDVGPVGFAKHLVWFVGREAKGFSLLWCYLNDSGKEFSCWLYSFPANSLTVLNFQGQYRYTKPTIKPASAPFTNFDITKVPEYIGEEFTYAKWTKSSGALDKLEMYQAPDRALASETPTPNPNIPKIALSQSKIHPLHVITLGSENGWREDGWKELHTLGLESPSNPYYFILYSNTRRGYALDLKTAQLYVADFVDPVKFGKAPAPVPPRNQVNKNYTYERLEIELTSPERYANPYLEVQVGIEFTTPDGKRITVPGFWDGDNRWKVRFVPIQVGNWKWKSLANVPELTGQTGLFQCVNSRNINKGPVRVALARTNPRHFSYENNDYFIPVGIREPLAASNEKDSLANMAVFQKYVEGIAGLGFNRLITGGLLELDAKGKWSSVNAGGYPLKDDSLQGLNLTYFQELDKRIALCNDKGILLELSMGRLHEEFLADAQIGDLFRFWGYIVARYAAYDVFWNPCILEQKFLSPILRKRLKEFVELTRFYDPQRRPITLWRNAESLGDEDLIEGSFQSLLDYVTLFNNPSVPLPEYRDRTKPYVLVEDNSNDTPDQTRKRMWLARIMQYYWLGNTPSGAFTDVLNHAETRSAKICADLFKKGKASRLQPKPEVILEGSSTQTPIYALVDSGREVVVYCERGGEFLLDLTSFTAKMEIVWINPRTGEEVQKEALSGSERRKFTAPDSNDWVLYVRRL